MEDNREDVYSKAVKAGKRTYFFDVKSTRGRDLYLTITESKKYVHSDGSTSYDKHKIFLYKEDFEKFIKGLRETVDEIDRLKSNGEFVQVASNGDTTILRRTNGEDTNGSASSEDVTQFTNVNFEDLEREDS